jgi:exodeoxyribonuclease VII large subunit
MEALTLTELCLLIGETLDDRLAPSYWVQAEISSLSLKGGHMYLELIDGKTAKMRATCWSGTQEMLNAYFESETGQQLQAGMKVLIETEVQFHPVYGLSLSIVGIDPAYTLGDIAQQRQRTIQQLEKDGLIDAQQLLPLPTLIRRIAVISSSSAAGYEDFKHQLDTSHYRFETQLFGATMQGEGAAKSIIAALEEIAGFDCVVIIRGGGATTDLSCFDNYELCAVCAQFDLPILTGIGHTRDVSVLDLVAHQALKTPTAVAEWLIHRMDDQMARINDLLMRLQRTAERQILIRRHRIELLQQRLAACNPERIYRMGYSLLTKNGQIIRSVHDLHPGDIVTTHLSDGSINSTITDNH